MEYLKPSWLISAPPLRAGLNPVILDTRFLDGYGCWGHFGPTGKPRGKGLPMDDFDVELKSMQNNYDCVEMANTCGAADPRNVDYDVGISMYKNLKIFL